MQNEFKLKRLVIAGGAAVFSLLAAPVISTSHVSLVSVAQAAEGTEGGHTGESGGTKGGSGKGQAKKGGTNESGHGGASKSTESVLSGEETDSDKKGPSYKGGSSASGKKGKPAYAGDIAKTGFDSTVEMGRLNVAKSPTKVIDKADKDALVTLFATPALYKLTSLDAVIAAIKSGFLPDGTPIVRIDSPLQNLGLYKDLLTDGKLVSATGTVFSGLSDVDLLAIFLGGASDKAGAAVSPDTVTNLNIIFGLTDKMTADQVTAVAAGAAAVQAAILEAHSE